MAMLRIIDFDAVALLASWGWLKSASPDVPLARVRLKEDLLTPGT